jgi:CheY-like chemotaxis protein
MRGTGRPFALPFDRGKMNETKAKFLIVDDDEAIRKLVEKVLLREGYSVDTARDGLEALGQLERNRYDGLILDLMMPSMSGFQLLDRLAAQPSIAPPCRIVMTAATGSKLVRIDDERVHAIISKPFDIQVLRTTVQSCILAALETVAPATTKSSTEE